MAAMKSPRVLVVVSLLLTTAVAAVPGAQVPYRILVTNDDGVRAPGILAIAQALKPLGEVTIIGPAENQSGQGHSISITDPIYVENATLPGGLEAIGLTATPASCVRLALGALLKQQPNLVVSGINRGSNLGMNAYVSGTVGAAREGALHGIPSIASSLDVAGGWSDYSAAAKHTAQIAEEVKRNGLPSGVFLNINVPTGVPKGVRIASESRLSGDESWVEQKNPRGRRYYWNDFKEPTNDVEGTDVSVFAAGYVAVVPLRVGEYDPAAA